ncbi:hypothetical protein WJX77_001045 [Trebouxia sp. C0004]
MACCSTLVHRGASGANSGRHLWQPTAEVPVWRDKVLSQHCYLIGTDVETSPHSLRAKFGFIFQDNALGYRVPELNLPMLNIFPLRVVGMEHNSIVYEALMEQEQAATRHAVKVFNLSKNGAAEAFIHERNVLKALQTSTETPGIHVLSKLVTFSSKCDSATAASIVTEAVVSQVSRDSPHEGVIQGYLQGVCVVCTAWGIEPRHLCVTLEVCPATVDLGDARNLGVHTDSPKKVWSYRGNWDARHDLVAFVNTFWAIQWERADLLNRVHASNIEGIGEFWAAQAANTGMGRKFQHALQFAEDSNYDTTVSLKG